jgi:glycosyltransferase involved in cell wall biosynthesis
LDALIAQTYSNLELIISDNASTDRTPSICHEYAARDARIRYYRNDVNVGVYANFNRSFALSSGEYFMWAAVDDIRPPNAVEKCLEALLTNPVAAMSHGPVLVKNEGSEKLTKISNELYMNGLSSTERVRVFTEALGHNGILYGLYRRSALSVATLGNCYGQDYLLCLQMCVVGPLEYVRAPMIICRERRAQPSSNPMYGDVPGTIATVLKDRGLRRRKCWVVLIMGAYYLAKLNTVSIATRLGAIFAHLRAFSALHQTRLARELVLQLCEPAAYLCRFSWRMASHWPITSRLARRLQARLGI